MSIYRVYTKKVGIPYSVSFKCAFCGKDNKVIHSAAVESSYSDKGTFTKRGLAKREENAEYKLRDKIGEEMDFMDNNIKRRHYSALGLTCKCSHCGRRPVWAYPDNIGIKILQVFGKIGLRVAVLMAMFVVLCMMEGGASSEDGSLIASFLLIALIICAPAVIYKIYQVLSPKIMDKNVSNLDIAYLPKIEYVGK